MIPLGLHVPLAVSAASVVVLITCLGNSRRTFTRSWVCGLVMTTALIYMEWRVYHSGLGVRSADTGIWELAWRWVFFGTEVLCWTETAIFLLVMSRYRENRGAADRYDGMLRSVPEDSLPDVDVWIASYNEGWDILEKTVIASLHLDYPKHKLKVYVLDDSRRDWLGERCREVGAIHVTRPDNVGKKAGNHTNALDYSFAPFILSLDADFVPFPNFIYRVLGFFEDPKVAVVQTPQTFHNVGPMRSAIGLATHEAPDDLAFFYREIQPARDAWDAAFYCGSCAMLRRSAIMAIGGFVTETDIEDQATAVKLLSHGYYTRYLNETLSVGLSAESAAVLHDQRNRWCRGSIQIMFMPFGPLGRGLKPLHRLFFLQTPWITWSVCPLLFAISPLMLWGPGFKVFPAADGIGTLLVPLSAFVAVMSAISWLSRRHWVPIVNQGTEIFLAFELAPTAITSALKPFGKPLVKILPVTPKGDEANTQRVDIRTFIPIAALALSLLGCVYWRLAFDKAPVPDPVELAAVLFWTSYALSVLAVAAAYCFDRPAPPLRGFVVEHPATVMLPDQTLPVVIHLIGLEGARMRWEHAPATMQGGVWPDTISLDIPSIGIVEATVESVDVAGQEVLVRFADLATEPRHRLIRSIFASPTIQFQPESFDFGTMMKGFARRFFA